MSKIVQAVQLTPERVKYPEVGFLADKSMLEAYQEGIKKYGEKARRTLDAFSFKDGVIKGSSPFSNVELASQELALPGELEHAVRLAPNTCRGIYADMGLVSRTACDSYAPKNEFLAKDLAKQVKHRTGIEPTLENPARLSLRGLTLKEDQNSAYGLIFLIGDRTEVIHVPEFSPKNHGGSFLTTDERGVPIFLTDKEISELSDEERQELRIFYARPDGLSGLYLGGDLDLGSDYRYLAYSDDGGRVVVKSAEGTAKGLADKL